MPIKITECDKIEKANLIIDFDKYENLNFEDSTIASATVTTNNYTGKIIVATVKIPINNYYKHRKPFNREITILEEIVQSIGVGCDSYTYYNSLFYEGKNDNKNLIAIDQKIIKLLYEPVIPVGYKLSQFEKDFEDVLYHVNTEQKIVDTLKKNKIEKNILDDIYANGFVNNKIIKFSGITYLKFIGDFTNADNTDFSTAINLINNISPNLKLQIIPSDSLVEGPSISIIANKISDQINLLDIKVSHRFKYNLVKPRLHEIKIALTYRDSVKSDGSILPFPNGRRNYTIGNAIGLALCLPSHKGSNFFNINSDKIEINPQYIKLLNSYYNNVITSGFTKSQLETVIKNY